MKNILLWAIVATCVAVGIYFGAMVGLGTSSLTAAFLVIGMAIAITVCPINIFSAFVALISAVGIFISAVFSEVFTVFFSILILVFTAFCVGHELKIKFRLVLVAYLVEGVGIYGLITLNVWWPALATVLILGVWWLTLYITERRALIPTS
jgi:hypothetical protein